MLTGIGQSITAGGASTDNYLPNFLPGLSLKADLFNVFNSNWPYTVNTTFSNAATSQWLRPTNVLQSRFFKLGAQIDF